MTNISADALRVLRDIHRRGITQLSSYGSKEFTYTDTDEDVPMSDVRVIQNELFRFETRTKTMVLNSYEKLVGVLERKQGRHIIRLYVLVNPENHREYSDEIEIEREFIGDDDTPDRDLAISIETPPTYRTFTHRVEILGLLVLDDIPMGDWFEERIGLKYHLRLTDKALALIQDSED